MWGRTAIVTLIASWLMRQLRPPLRRQMNCAWVDLLPGFYWLSWGRFALGLVETIAYDTYFGLVFALLYNFFLVKVWRHAS